MTAPLARDQFGNPVPLPPEAKYFLVRRHTGGRPANISGPDGQPLHILVTEDLPDLRARGCGGSIRLDALDGERRQLPVPAIYVELGSTEETPRATSGESDKELVRVGFESMTRTMEAMQRSQVERERTLAQKEQALTESQIASQKMIVELMIAVLDRMGGAKPQDALSLLKQQFEIQKTLERQVIRNAPALPEPLPAPEPKDDGIPGWLRIALPGLQEFVVGMVANGDEAKAQMVRNMCGAVMNGAMSGGAPALPQAMPAPQQIVDVRRVAPKPMREVLAMLEDDEALVIEQLLAKLNKEDYLTACEEVAQIPDLDGRLVWARRIIARVTNQDQPEVPPSRTMEVPGIPPELIPVLAQLSPEDQQFGLQLVSWLDRAMTEKLVAKLSALPPQNALEKIRSMIDEARRRGPSVAQRAVNAMLRDEEGSHRNGTASKGGAS